MKISTKIIAILVLVLVAVLYIWYSQYRITKLEESNKELSTNLESALQYNSAYVDTINSYVAAIAEKEKEVKQAQVQLLNVMNQYKGLQDEKAKEFLNTSTPDNIRRVLESTDYYSKASSANSSSNISGTK